MYKSNIRNAKKRGQDDRHREFLMPNDGQGFAVVQDMLGNGRVRCLCEDETVRIGRIRGSMRKFKNKVIIGRGDLVIVGLRDYEDDKVDIMHKYTHDECSTLLMNGTLSAKLVKAVTNRDDVGKSTADDEADDYILFGETGDINIAEI
jgi:translation initiation factor 1A